MTDIPPWCSTIHRDDRQSGARRGRPCLLMDHSPSNAATAWRPWTVQIQASLGYTLLTIGSIREAVKKSGPHNGLIVDDRKMTDVILENSMCRNIRTLFNFEPPATEVRSAHRRSSSCASSAGLRIPRKTMRSLSSARLRRFPAAAHRLLVSLQTASPARNRRSKAAKALARAKARFP